MTTLLPDDLDGEMVLPGKGAPEGPRPRAKIRGELAWLAEQESGAWKTLRTTWARRVVLWLQLVRPPPVTLEESDL